MKIGVVAHISRLKMAGELTEEVCADVFALDHITPADPEDGMRRAALNHRSVLRSLSDLAGPGEWCVVLEDDAVPVAGFRGHVENALACAPTPVVGLYLGRGNPSGEVQRQVRQGLTLTKAWLTADFFISSVGYAIRRGMAAGLVAWCDTVDDEGDEWPRQVSRWAQDNFLLTSYTNPSLVDHADAESVISPTWAAADRKAWSVGARSDWTGRVYRLGHCPGWSPA